MTKILIVGGVAGGATAAARLRRLNERAEIILFEKGEYISFANCGLPYHIGGVIAERDALLLQTPESFHSRFNIDVRILSEVTSIDRAAKTICVRDLRGGRDYCENYDDLILAPGAAPILPHIPGVDSKRVFALRNIADMDKITAFMRANAPRTALVVGGGYIGVETAENLKCAGLDVSITELSDQALAPLDFDMACAVHRHLRQRGVSLYLNDGVRSIEEKADGLYVTLENQTLHTDMLILAIGVRPESALAKNAGLLLDDRGGIVVDRRMRTSDAHIFAAGDAVVVTDVVTGQPASLPLAGPANKQGRIAADNICGIPSEYDGAQGSAILKVFDLTVASTGLNEKTAKRLNLDYDKVFAWLPGHAGYYPGAEYMSIKALYEKGSGRILGAQLVGHEGVDKRCDAFATAARFKMTARDLARMEFCYAPPFGSAKDPVNIVGYMIENVLDGRVQNFHWHDADGLPRDGSITLLDVRTQEETKAGRMAGSLAIPLDELRARAHELPKDKPVYLYCHSGLRSYVAARILAQNGYEAYNLCGGYRLYQTIKNELSLGKG